MSTARHSLAATAYDPPRPWLSAGTSYVQAGNIQLRTVNCGRDGRPTPARVDPTGFDCVLRDQWGDALGHDCAGVHHA